MASAGRRLGQSMIDRAEDGLMSSSGKDMKRWVYYTVGGEGQCQVRRMHLREGAGVGHEGS